MTSFDFKSTSGRYHVVFAPDGTQVSQHTELVYAQEAALNHAFTNGIDGTYRIVRDATWEITTVGFKAKSQNPGDVLPPSVPTGVTAAITNAAAGEATLTWNASTDASGIKEYRVNQVGALGTFVVDAALPRSRVFPGLLPNVAYSFQVAAVDTHGNVTLPITSNTVTIVPAAELDWTIPDVPYSLPNLAADTSDTVDLSSLFTNPAGVPVKLIVLSDTANGNVITGSELARPARAAGGYSMTVGLVESVGRVLNLAALGVSQVAIQLSWTAVAGATGYEVETSLTGASGWTTLATVVSATYTHSGLAAASTRYYRVRAVGVDQAGEYSSIVNATTQNAVGSGDWEARSNEDGVVWAHRMDEDDFFQFLRVTGDDFDPVTNTRNSSGSYPNTAPFPLIPRVNPTAGPDGGPCIQYRNIGTTTTANIAADTAVTQIPVLDSTDFPDPVAHGIKGYQVVLQNLGLSETNRERVWVTAVDHDTHTLTVVRNWRGTGGVIVSAGKGQLLAWNSGTTIGWDCEGAWTRPLAAFVAGPTGNGKALPDRAANGTVTRRNYTRMGPNDSISPSFTSFRKGYYGHADYHAKFPTWLNQADVWDGNEFYLQWRMFITPDRLLTDRAGKLWFLHNTVTGNTSQIVGLWATDGGGDTNANPAAWRAFHCYGDARAKGTGPLGSPQNDGQQSLMQPGSAGAETCIRGGPRGGCWRYPLGQWMTFLMRVKPGHHDDATYGRGTWDGATAGDIVVDTTQFTPVKDNTAFTLEFETNQIPAYSKAQHASWVNPNGTDKLKHWNANFCIVDTAIEQALPGFADYNRTNGNLTDFKVVSHYVTPAGRVRWVVTKATNGSKWPTGLPPHGMTFGVEISSPDALTQPALYHDTEMEVWVAEEGDTDYTLLYSKTDQIAFFGDDLGIWSNHPPGYNLFQPTAYQNVQDGQRPPTKSYDYMFAQFILSKSWIRPPA